jgi:hypothetical protein
MFSKLFCGVRGRAGSAVNRSAKKGNNTNIRRNIHGVALKAPPHDGERSLERVFQT